MEAVFFSHPMSSRTDLDKLSPTAQAAVDLVADYYRQQMAFENDLERLTEILDWVRQSCSCLTLAGELAAGTRQELLLLLSSSETDKERTEEQNVAEALGGLAQEQTLQERKQTDVAEDRTRIVLPDYEQLRRGDRVEVVSSTGSNRYGVFQQYTDPRIGDYRRQAEVILDGTNEVSVIEPRQLRFAPDVESYADRYEHLRTWKQESFELRLYETGRVDRHGKSFLAFEFFDREFQGEDTVPLFHGEDFCCSPLHAVDSDATVATLLSFLGLSFGDTDAEYFAGYSSRQLAWRDDRADVLSWLAHELETGFSNGKT